MLTPAYIAIVEDDDDLRNHLANVIDKSDGFELAFAASRLSEAMQVSREKNVDAYLVDLNLPDGMGFEFVRDVKSRTNSKVLILTVLADRRSVLMALKAGADGYLLKDADRDQIIASLQDVLSGDTPISPQAATYLLRTFTEVSQIVSTEKTNNLESLTERERDTLMMFERGLSYKEAADALGVSHNTIRSHVKSIYSKLNVSSRNEALFEARQQGLLNPD